MTIKGILGKIWEVLKAIRDAKFLMRLRIDKYFHHVIYTFFLVWMMIWMGIKIQDTLVKVEKNEERLNDLKIYYSQKTVELSSIRRISVIEDLLRKQGSEVTFPEQPATVIKK